MTLRILWLDIAENFAQTDNHTDIPTSAMALRESSANSTHSMHESVISLPTLHTEQHGRCGCMSMRMRKAKIVCTIGPASNSPAVVDQLIESGMNAARLNFSHGTHEWHAATITAIRHAAARQGSAVAIIQDLQGPRIRVGLVPKAGIELTTGQSVRLRPLTQSDGPLDLQVSAHDPLPEIPVTYPALARDLRVGARVLINDGLIELQAVRIADDLIECAVIMGGTVTSYKGVNLPDTAVSAPSLTEKDREDIRFGAEHGVDYVALSFVRGPQDIEAARAVLTEQGLNTPIIAKIERAEAIDALREILEQADGVMVARGDLGVEMGPEAVPLLQKRIIVEANRRRRLVITATQMLESMTQVRRPTRAEASDVANAVLDGSDALMLSAETAIGKHPIETVHVMDRIIRAAEEAAGERMEEKHRPTAEDLSIAEAICASASSAAQSIAACAIVVFTEGGTTARLISKYRPTASLLAFTPSEAVRRQLALYWGVRPFTMSRGSPPEAWIQEAEQRLKTEHVIKTGDRIAVVSGTMAGQVGGTNTLKLHEIG
jgi:pyruvate kinase